MFAQKLKQVRKKNQVQQQTWVFEQKNQDGAQKIQVGVQKLYMFVQKHSFKSTSDWQKCQKSSQIKYIIMYFSFF